MTLNSNAWALGNAVYPFIALFSPDPLKPEVVAPDRVLSKDYLSLPPTRQDLTQGQKPEGRLKWG